MAQAQIETLFAGGAAAVLYIAVQSQRGTAAVG